MPRGRASPRRGDAALDDGSAGPMAGIPICVKGETTDQLRTATAELSAHQRSTTDRRAVVHTRQPWRPDLGVKGSRVRQPDGKGPGEGTCWTA